MTKSALWRVLCTVTVLVVVLGLLRIGEDVQAAKLLEMPVFPLYVYDVPATADQLDPFTRWDLLRPLDSSYVISGTVWDGLAGRPLYARVTIAADPEITSTVPITVWTHPTTGFYSATVEAGVTYTFQAAAWATGYSGAVQEVISPENQTVDLKLIPELVNCGVPGYQVVDGVSETFDLTPLPGLPVGWATVPVTGNAGLWTTVTATAYPAGYFPHSAPEFLRFNAYEVNSGGAARFAMISSFDLSLPAPDVLTFWMFHDDESAAGDRLQVQISTDEGLSWSNVGAAILRYGSPGWVSHTVDLSAYGDQTAVRLGFLGISDYGNDLYLDDLSVGAPLCRPQFGSFVSGNVYDGNFPTRPLAGAVVMGGGDRVETVATVDPAVDDGFYQLFVPMAETTTTTWLTATAGGYVPQSFTATMVVSAGSRLDFFLPAGLLLSSPETISAVLVAGQPVTAGWTLTNSGSVTATYLITENEPWLTVAVTSGTLGIGQVQTVGLTFTTTGMQPGVYFGNVGLLSDTPYGNSGLVVQLTVTPAPGWGAVTGVISTPGRCDAAPTVLAGVPLRLRTRDGVNITLTTDLNGRYLYWVDPVFSPLSLTLQLAGYQSRTITRVTVSGNATTTVDFNVRKSDPCVQFQPLQWDAAVPRGMAVSRVFTLTNVSPVSTVVAFLEVSPSLTRTAAVLQSAAWQRSDARTAPAQVGRLVPVYDPGKATVLAEGFEAGAVPPAGWSRVVLNSHYTWQVDESGGAHSGGYAAQVQLDPAPAEQDEWLLTPPLFLTGGTLSFWSFGSVTWCKAPYDNCDLRVWIVRGEPGGGDDSLIGKGDDAWTANFTYAQSVLSLNRALAPAGENVRIGFEYIGNDGAQVGLDDVLLESPDVEWLKVSPTTVILLADGRTAVTLTVTALPTLPARLLYQAGLLVRSGDSMGPFTVPVSMEIQAVPTVTVEVGALMLENQATTFTVTADGTQPMSFTWNFGDGTGEESTVELTRTHVYTRAGEYTVAVTATNGLGAGFYSRTVAIEGAPRVGFSFPTGTLWGGMPVTFTNQTYAHPAATTYLWDFGDPVSGLENTSTLTNPVHTFYLSGTYTVTLTATNFWGTVTATQTVGISRTLYRVLLPLIAKKF